MNVNASRTWFSNTDQDMIVFELASGVRIKYMYMTHLQSCKSISNFNQRAGPLIIKMEKYGKAAS